MFVKNTKIQTLWGQWKH